MKLASLLLPCAVLAASLASAAEQGARRDLGPCRADAEKFCKDVEPGGGRIVACLKAHEDELSAACKAKGAELKDRLKKEQGEWSAACGKEKEAFCKDAQVGGGRVASCLRGHMSDKGFSETCRDFMAKKKERFEEQHPRAAEAMEACSADKETFCKDVQPGEGRIIACLEQHKGDKGFSSSCREKIGRKKGAAKEDKD